MELARKRWLIAAPLAATAVAVSVALIPPFAGASSHREAPAITQDPAADNNDVYAFRSPDRPDTATIVATYIPLEEPSGGPNYFQFSDQVRYRINIDNTGDGAEDVAYLFRFKTKYGAVNPNSFLHNVLPVTFANGVYKNLNIVQTYTVEKVVKRSGKVVRRVVGRDLLVPPDNVGPKSTPNYESQLVPPAIQTLTDGTRVFAGQRDDPFFVDLGAIFDLVNIDAPGRPKIGLGDQGGGVDNLKDYSTHAIAIQVPIGNISRTGKVPTDASDPRSVIGVYASAERPVVTFRNGAPVSRFRQVSRLGEPLINEVVIPLGQKDRWNASEPEDDAQFLNRYTKPELAADLNVLFPGVINAPETNRIDLATILGTGLPPGNPTGLVTQIGRAKPAFADLLRVNLAIAPTPFAQQKRLGVLAGDLDGFPNGRRLIDDVVDIELKAVGGALAPVFGLPAPTPNAAKLGDGVDANDKPFQGSFPYLASPTSGFDVTPHGG